MMIAKKLLFALSALAVAVPVAASAGGWYGHEDRGYGERGYGDYGRFGDYRYDRGFRGYPEFYGVKAHIRQELMQGMQQGWLDRDDGWRLMQGLRRVNESEAREFREHGWNLPYEDRVRFKSTLDRIDHEIDEARDAF